MSFPFALSRMIALCVIIICNITSLALSALAFHEKTGGAFQALALCFTIFILLSILCCTCHQLAHRGEEASNTRNVTLFGFCGLLGFALATSLTVHAQQDGFCGDFAKVASPCTIAGLQLGMAYVSLVSGLFGFVIAWIDKLPGAVKVTPRYPITKAPSSRFAAHAHDLDESYYTPPPARMATRPRNDAEWSDIPLY